MQEVRPMQRILTRGLPIAVVFIAASAAFNHLSAIVEDPSASLMAVNCASVGMLVMVFVIVLTLFYVIGRFTQGDWD
jgi:membrane protein YdbS with pleckstrin-like domain